MTSSARPHITWCLLLVTCLCPTTAQQDMTPCNKQVDAVFILDGSSGLTDAEFTKVMNLTLEFIGHKNRSPASTLRAGVIVVGDYVTHESPITDDVTALSDLWATSLEHVPRPGSDTHNLGLGIEMAFNALVTQPQATGTQRVIIALTSQESAEPQRTSFNADWVRQLGMSVYVIALKDAAMAEARVLSGSADHFLSMTSLQEATQLPDIDLELDQVDCGLTTTTLSTTTTTSTTQSTTTAATPTTSSMSPTPLITSPTTISLKTTPAPLTTTVMSPATPTPAPTTGLPAMTTEIVTPSPISTAAATTSRPVASTERPTSSDRPTPSGTGRPTPSRTERPTPSGTGRPTPSERPTTSERPTPSGTERPTISERPTTPTRLVSTIPAASTTTKTTPVQFKCGCFFTYEDAASQMWPQIQHGFLDQSSSSKDNDAILSDEPAEDYDEMSGSSLSDDDDDNEDDDDDDSQDSNMSDGRNDKDSAELRRESIFGKKSKMPSLKTILRLMKLK